MIIVYILAVIGGVCLLGAASMVIMLVIATSRDDEEKETSCAQCVYTGLYEDCKDCPVSEEAKKIGNR